MSAPCAIVFTPLPTIAPTTLNVIVHVPDMIVDGATGIVPAVMLTTVPLIDGLPPTQVVARFGEAAKVAPPAIVAMSSVNDVTVADVSVDVFCSVIVTVDVPPKATDVGENALLTRIAASAAPRPAMSAKRHTNCAMSARTSQRCER